MIVFIVPVKSKQLSSDWSHFSKLVERTLGSICQQRDKNFKAVIVCHELPETKINDSSLEFVKVDFEPPKLTDDADLNNSLKEKDKALKIKKGIEEGSKFNPHFYMVVDSDDCINDRISLFVNKQEPQVPGWYMKKGYFYREGQNYAFLNKKSFNRFCGTSLILNANNIEKMFVENPLLSFNHKIEPETLGLKVFPFPAALYSMGNGENHAMSKENIQGLLNKPNRSLVNLAKSLMSKLKKYRPQLLTNGFRKKYNFYNIG